MSRKVFVETIVKFDLEGNMTPLSITWENGHIYEIDKITDVRRAASLKAGGMGWRYTCVIEKKEKYLFYDLCDKKWFVEGK